MAKRPLVDFSSGAYRRAAAKLPKQGTGGPWASRQSYWRDFLTLRFAPLRSGGLAVLRSRPGDDGAAQSRRRRRASEAERGEITRHSQIVQLVRAAACPVFRGALRTR